VAAVAESSPLSFWGGRIRTLQQQQARPLRVLRTMHGPYPWTPHICDDFNSKHRDVPASACIWPDNQHHTSKLQCDQARSLLLSSACLSALLYHLSPPDTSDIITCNGNDLQGNGSHTARAGSCCPRTATHGPAAHNATHQPYNSNSAEGCCCRTMKMEGPQQIQQHIAACRQPCINT